MCRGISGSLVAAVFLMVAPAISAQSPALSKIEKRLTNEPMYQSKPGYLLLALGREAQHKAWLVLDGTMLYVDRRGDGDLTPPECRVVGEKENDGSTYFKAGDINVGEVCYANLQVWVRSAKRSIGAVESPMFQQFLADHPEGNLYNVSIDVPFEKPLTNVVDASPLKSTAHVATNYDSMGILQFSPRPQDASIMHVGGAWCFAPDGPQKLVRGRSEDLVLRLGTPGVGPGTFAHVSYDYLVPKSGMPKLSIEFPGSDGEKPLLAKYLLEDRC